jgi:hypothetical protein
MPMKLLPLAAGLVALACAGARADVIDYDISMDTAPLIGHPAGPFSLEFQLNDGGGTGDGNNTAVLSGFSFGGGAPVGSPTLIGGASGDAGTAISITDSSFFNQFIQEFTPGNQLDFHLALTTNLDAGGVPDQFTFAILDSSGSELPTESFFNVFVEIDIDSSNPAVLTFASNPTQSPIAGGPPIDIAAPTATPSGTPSIPEPGSLALLATAVSVGWLGARRGERSQRR